MSKADCAGVPNCLLNSSIYHSLFNLVFLNISIYYFIFISTWEIKPEATTEGYIDIFNEQGYLAEWNLLGMVDWWNWHFKPVLELFGKQGINHSSTPAENSCDFFLLTCASCALLGKSWG